MKEKAIGPFDFVNDINFKSGRIDNTDQYIPFVINRQFSYFRDCIFFANAMNQYPLLDKDMQYDFYRLVVERGKRFSKWAKPEASLLLDAIMDILDIKKSEAMLYESILSEEKKSEILEYYRVKNGGLL